MEVRVFTKKEGWAQLNEWESKPITVNHYQEDEIICNWMKSPRETNVPQSLKGSQSSSWLWLNSVMFLGYHKYPCSLMLLDDMVDNSQSRPHVCMCPHAFMQIVKVKLKRGCFLFSLFPNPKTFTTKGKTFLIYRCDLSTVDVYSINILFNLCIHSF